MLIITDSRLRIRQCRNPSATAQEARTAIALALETKRQPDHMSTLSALSPTSMPQQGCTSVLRADLHALDHQSRGMVRLSSHLSSSRHTQKIEDGRWKIVAPMTTEIPRSRVQFPNGVAQCSRATRLRLYGRHRFRRVLLSASLQYSSTQNHMPSPDASYYTPRL